MIHTHLLLTPVPSPQTVPLFWVLAGMMRGCHCDQRCRRRTRGCNRGNGVSTPSIPPYPAPGFITVRIFPSLGYSVHRGPRLCSRLLPSRSGAAVIVRKLPRSLIQAIPPNRDPLDSLSTTPSPPIPIHLLLPHPPLHYNTTALLPSRRVASLSRPG